MFWTKTVCSWPPFAWETLLTASAFLEVTGQFKLFIRIYLTVISVIHWEKCIFHFDFPTLWSIVFEILNYSLGFLSICCYNHFLFLNLLTLIIFLLALLLLCHISLGMLFIHFHWILESYCILSLIYALSPTLFSIEMFNVCPYVGFTLFLLLFIFSLNPWWGGLIWYRGLFQFSCFCWDLLCAYIKFWECPIMYCEKVYSFVFPWNVLYIFVMFIWFIMSVSSIISVISFCMDNLSICESGQL